MSLVAAARRLYAALDPHAVVVGGVCAAMHGVERFTRDVDLATDLGPSETVTALAEHDLAGRLRRGGPHDPLSWVVSGKVDDVDFQVLPAADVGVVTAHAELRAELRIASIEDFIESKCIAGGHQDLHDVAVLILLDATRLSPARERARTHGCADKLDAWLSDARLLARYPRPQRR